MGDEQPSMEDILAEATSSANAVTVDQGGQPAAVVSDTSISEDSAALTAEGYPINSSATLAQDSAALTAEGYTTTIPTASTGSTGTVTNFFSQYGLYLAAAIGIGLGFYAFKKGDL